ncbi:hypothetical protein ST21_013 [Aeromonas phage ST21]|uniref:Uncharacterized protein n=1 Tax=Aeromonas phage ST21 TaxID=3065691 RepID=A0AA96J421_9CAUD|nr:hypothetical protein ST21_013 [Aeromonas phage ST21]
MSHILLLTERELKLINRVRAELQRLARGGVPSHSNLGICWNISASLGCKLGVKPYPDDYTDFTGAVYKLFNNPSMSFYGEDNYREEVEAHSHKQLTAVMFTRMCATSFSGFELTGDGYYPIPNERGNASAGDEPWDGHCGARRRLFCQHMVDVIDNRLAERDSMVVRLLRPSSVISQRDKDLLWAFTGAFGFLPQARPLPGRAVTSGLCFRITSMVENMLYNNSLLSSPNSSNAAGPLHSVAVRLVVSRLHTVTDKHWKDQLLIALKRLTSRLNGSVPSFVGAVALCCHPDWFEDVPANDTAVQDAMDYPIPGGKEAYCSPCTDNWMGEGLELRLALAESCAKQLRLYLNGEL